MFNGPHVDLLLIHNPKFQAGGAALRLPADLRDQAHLGKTGP